MGYRNTHVVMARVGRRVRVMGPFTSEFKANDFLAVLDRQPGMDEIPTWVAPLRPPKARESASALKAAAAEYLKEILK